MNAVFLVRCKYFSRPAHPRPHTLTSHPSISFTSYTTHSHLTQYTPMSLYYFISHIPMPHIPYVTHPSPASCPSLVNKLQPCNLTAPHLDSTTCSHSNIPNSSTTSTLYPPQPRTPAYHMCSILTKGSTCRNIPKPWKQVVKYNIPVFISIGQNYFTAFYVSKYCFASFYILFVKNLNYKQFFFIIM